MRGDASIAPYSLMQGGIVGERGSAPPFHRTDFEFFQKIPHKKRVFRQVLSYLYIEEEIRQNCPRAPQLQNGAKAGLP